MDDEGLLTTAEVARRLGVKPETVYAYVSRGQLTSRRERGTRSSLFSVAEVDRLASGRMVRRRPAGMMESVATRLTLLEDDELYYRGYRVRELAGTRTLESVAALLWFGDLDDDFRVRVAESAVARVRPVVAALPEGARLTDLLRVGVAAVAPTDPWRFDLTPSTVTRSGGALLRGLVEALTPPGPPSATLAERLWPLLTSRGPQPEVLDVALVLLADHGLAVSTVTARVAASARAHVHAVVSAGLGALDGPFHGTASTAAHRFLADALADPDAALAERLRAGEPVPGFGHAVYRRRDPRAGVLLDLVRPTPVGAVVAELVAQLAASGHPAPFPNVDLALAAVAHAHDMRPDAGEAIFAVARTVGWIAHALEEYSEPGLRFRSPGSYIGPRPRPVPRLR